MTGSFTALLLEMVRQNTAGCSAGLTLEFLDSRGVAAGSNSSPRPQWFHWDLPNLLSGGRKASPIPLSPQPQCWKWVVHPLLLWVGNKGDTKCKESSSRAK